MKLLLILITITGLYTQRPTHVFDTFKSTRLINIHTTEQLYNNTMELSIGHRFGDVHGGIRDFFGLDISPAMYLSFDYAMSDNLQFGLGRMSRQKVYEISTKYRILRQQREEGSPVSISTFSTILFQTEKNQEETAAMIQLLVARKINKTLSFQLTPFFIQRLESEQVVATQLLTVGSQSAYGLGLSTRIAVSKHASVMLEWSGIINKPDWNKNSLTRDQIRGNAVSIGFNVEVAGHSFQIMASNTAKLNRIKSLMGYTDSTTDFTDGHFFLGFNLNRLFDFN